MTVRLEQRKLGLRRTSGTLDLIYRYGFFLLTLLSLTLASIKPNFGGINGVVDGYSTIWYFAIPLTYFETGLLCSPKALCAALRNGHVLSFVVILSYIVMPFIARLGTCLLTYAQLNVWLLKGMEVLYCMPPPFSTGIVLSRLAQADLPASVVTTLVSHFVGLFVSPVLLYFMLGTSTAPLVGVNVREMVYSTVIPLITGIALQSSIKSCDARTFVGKKTRWFSEGLLLITAYHWFCDALTVDASFLQPLDILLCILIAIVSQLLIGCVCLTLCSPWLQREVLLAALLTSMHKSVGLGGWILRGAYHGSAHGPAVILPLSILPVAQLLLSSLLASWLAP